MVRRYAHLAADQLDPSHTSAHLWHTKSEFDTFLAQQPLELSIAEIRSAGILVSEVSALPPTDR